MQWLVHCSLFTCPLSQADSNHHNPCLDDGDISLQNGFSESVFALVQSVHIYSSQRIPLECEAGHAVHLSKIPSSFLACRELKSKSLSQPTVPSYGCGPCPKIPPLSTTLSSKQKPSCFSLNKLGVKSRHLCPSFLVCSFPWMLH